MALNSPQNSDDDDDDIDFIEDYNPGLFSTYSVAPLSYMEIVAGDWWTNSFTVSLYCETNQLIKLTKFNISKMKDILKEVIDPLCLVAQLGRGISRLNRNIFIDFQEKNIHVAALQSQVKKIRDYMIPYVRKYIMRALIHQAYVHIGHDILQTEKENKLEDILFRVELELFENFKIPKIYNSHIFDNDPEMGRIEIRPKVTYNRQTHCATVEGYDYAEDLSTNLMEELMYHGSRGRWSQNYIYRWEEIV